MICSGIYISKMKGSRCNPQLIMGGGDGGGHGAGDELLVVGRGDLGEIGSLGRDFNGDGGPGDVIQRPERSGQGTNRDLSLLQFGGNGRRGASTQRQRATLGLGPGAEGTAIIVPVRQQRGIDAYAVAAGGGVQRDVNCGMIGVGGDGELLEGHVGVGVA